MSEMSHDNALKPIPALSRVLPNPFSADAAIYYVLAMAWVLLALLAARLGAPGFLDPGNIANVLFQTSFVALLAVPMTLLLISGNFDLSIGANAALCAACLLLLDDRVGPVGAVALTLACGTFLGLVNGLIVQGLGINAFIVTLGMMTALRGLLTIVTNGRTAVSHNTAGMAVLRTLGTGSWTLPHPLAWLAAAALIGTFASGLRRRVTRATMLSRGISAVLLLIGLLLPGSWSLAKSVYYTAGIALVAAFLTDFTIVGRRLQATGSNLEAARLAGIRVAAYKVVPFVLNGTAAAVVGMLFAARLGSVLPNAMAGLELTVIAAAILGGTSLFGGSGSVLRSIAGSVLLFSLLNGFDIVGLGSSYQGVVEGVVLVAAAAMYTIRPHRASAAIQRSSTT